MYASTQSRSSASCPCTSHLCTLPPVFPSPATCFTCRYGAEQGQGSLREALANTFYKDLRAADEIFVSDGSKCDIARIQMMFGSKASVAVQVSRRGLPLGMMVPGGPCGD